MTDAGQELLAKYVAQRNAEAFRELVHLHKDMVYATCLRVLGHDADAEDAAQNCFLALARKPEQVRGSLTGWLHRTALNAAIEMLRQAKARRGREEQAMKREATRDEPAWEQVAPAVDRAIDDLPEELRLPIIRYYLEGQKQEEIAQELDVTQSAVSKCLQRGTDELRQRLTKAGITLGVAALASLLSTNAAHAAPATLTAVLGKMALAGATGAGKVATSAAGAAVGVGSTSTTAGAVTGGLSVMSKVWIAVVGVAAVGAGGLVVSQGSAGTKPEAPLAAPVQPAVAPAGPTAPPISVEDLSAAIRVREEAVGNVRLVYEAEHVTVREVDLDRDWEPQELLKALDMTVQQTDKGVVTFNRKRGLLLFVVDATGRRQEYSETWYDLTNGLTKRLRSGPDFGSRPSGRIGTDGSGSELRDDPTLTPLSFMYWPRLQTTLGRAILIEPIQANAPSAQPLAGQRDFKNLLRSAMTPTSEMLTRPEPVSISSAALSEGQEAFKVRMMGPPGGHCVWFVPEQGLLPMRRDMLMLDFKQASDMPVLVVPPGADLNWVQQNWRVLLDARKIRAEDYVIKGNMAVPNVEVKFKGAQVLESYQIFSTATTKEGVVYPTDMIMVRSPLKGASKSTWATRIRVKSCEKLGDDALVDWDFPAGTYVHDERNGVHYQVEAMPDIPRPAEAETVAGKMFEGIAGATRLRTALRMYLNAHGEFPRLTNVTGDALAPTLGLRGDELEGRYFKPASYAVNSRAKNYTVTATLEAWTYTVNEYGGERREYQTVAGLVRSATQPAMPVPEAIVRGFRLAVTNPEYSQRHADADGRFALFGPTGRVLLYGCSPDGNLAVIRKLSADEDHEQVLLSLDPAATVTGQLLEAGDIPSVKPRIAVQSWAKEEPPEVRARQLALGVGIPSWDDTGRFTIQGLPPGGEYEIVFSQDEPVKRTRTLSVRIDAPGVRDLGRVYWNQP